MSSEARYLQRRSDSWVRAKASPSQPIGESGPGSLHVTILHTNSGATFQAMAVAQTLTKGLSAEIRLLVLQVVPYPLPLDAPDVSIEFTENRLLSMASQLNIDLRVEISLGRDRGVMLESAIKPGSVVVIGGKRHWWAIAERRLTRRLERLGHQIVFSGSKC